jgi:hypothetical protein
LRQISSRPFRFLFQLERRLPRQQQGFVQMMNPSGRAVALRVFAAGAILTFATPTFSQAPTEAQRSAIKSECRSDYMAHCSDVPPGGMASLQCLQKNMSRLSSGCQSAVSAVEAPAAPKAEARPEAKPEKSEAKPETKPESAPGAALATPTEKPAASRSKSPSSTQVAAIRSACRSDYMARCAGVPTGGAAALSCLKQNESKLSPGCQQALNAVGDGAPGGNTAPASRVTPPGTATAAPAATPDAGPIVLRPMRPREELFVLRSACGGDVRALCGDVPPGGGRIVQCLAARAASLSPGCRDVLTSFAP